MDAATIYLADRRGELTAPNVRLCCTLNFKDFTQADRPPAGGLRYFNEVSVAPGATELFSAESRLLSVVLPVTGSLCVDGQHVAVGEISIRTLDAGQVCLIRNNDEPAVINYLHFGYDMTVEKASIPPEIRAFDLRAHRNKLQLYGETDHLPLQMGLGLFDHRYEAAYTMRPGNHLFAFVIYGSFEVNGRLLHDRDALFLREAEQADIEALGQDSIIFLLFLE